jgi:hypothetical protein
MKAYSLALDLLYADGWTYGQTDKHCQPSRPSFETFLLRMNYKVITSTK